jgi:hypothetical protein
MRHQIAMTSTASLAKKRKPWQDGLAKFGLYKLDAAATYHPPSLASGGEV